jgi:hypothetical protein
MNINELDIDINEQNIMKLIDDAMNFEENGKRRQDKLFIGMLKILVCMNKNMANIVNAQKDVERHDEEIKEINLCLNGNGKKGLKSVIEENTTRIKIYGIVFGGCVGVLSTLIMFILGRI